MRTAIQLSLLLRWGRRLLVLLSLMAPSFVAAQDGGQAAAAPPSTPAVADVNVDGRVLFHVRGIRAYPAERRAKEIAERVRVVAADESVSIDSARIETPEPGRIQIYMGDRSLFELFDADAQIEGIPLSLLGKTHVLRV